MGMTSNYQAKEDELNLEDLDDALHDTFAPKEKKDEEKKDDDGDGSETKEETAAVPETPVVENEMTLTEQLEYAKAQAEKDEKER